jgi:hypothetical protein
MRVDWKLKTMLEQTSGTQFLWSQQKKHKEEVLIWKLCFVISYGIKDTLGQVLKKMV